MNSTLISDLLLIVNITGMFPDFLDSANLLVYDVNTLSMPPASISVWHFIALRQNTAQSVDTEPRKLQGSSHQADKFPARTSCCGTNDENLTSGVKHSNKTLPITMHYPHMGST